jgi:hypothetical protein
LLRLNIGLDIGRGNLGWKPYSWALWAEIVRNQSVTETKPKGLIC